MSMALPINERLVHQPWTSITALLQNIAARGVMPQRPKAELIVAGIIDRTKPAATAANLPLGYVCTDRHFADCGDCEEIGNIA